MEAHTPLNWIHGLLFMLASALGVDLDASPRSPPPQAVWDGPSPDCHLACWSASSMGCNPHDDCGRWCADLNAMATCAPALDAFFSCVRGHGRAMRSCDPESPDRGIALACATERRAVNDCYAEFR